MLIIKTGKWKVYICGREKKVFNFIRLSVDLICDHTMLVEQS